jgi:hypothetical protein
VPLLLGGFLLNIEKSMEYKTSINTLEFFQRRWTTKYQNKAAILLIDESVTHARTELLNLHVNEQTCT